DKLVTGVQTCALPISLLLVHERIRVIGRRRERLLDCARRHPTHEIQLRSRLVIRPRAARAAEWLLTDDRAGGLVVDVEVARRVEIGRASCRERVWVWG